MDRAVPEQQKAAPAPKAADVPQPQVPASAPAQAADTNAPKPGEVPK
jgi:hypothetical protein